MSELSLIGWGFAAGFTTATVLWGVVAYHREREVAAETYRRATTRLLTYLRAAGRLVE